MEKKVPFLDQKIKQEVNPDFITTRNVQDNISDVTAEIKQEVYNEGHTVKREIKYEGEVHICAERNNKSMHCPSSLPIGDSLQSCEERKQETNGDCHKYQRAIPDTNIEADCVNSYTKVEIMHTNYLEMPEIKQHLSSFGDTYYCPLCYSPFLQHDVLDEHMKTAHRNGHWKFDNKHVDLQDVLSQHSGTKMDETINKKRDVTFTDAAREDNMKLRLTDNKPLMNFIYSHKQTANLSHNLNCNTPALKNEACNINCRKIFSVSETNVQLIVSDRAVATYSDLSIETHKTREQKKPYKFDTVKKNLQQHNRLHTGEKPFKCDLCGAAFTQRSSLINHTKTHTGEKPYKCDVCDAAFIRKCQLQSHKKVHTGEKPYKCDVCGIAFTQSGNLKRHKTLHTGEKPYKCDFCGIAYNQSGNLKMHKTLHTGEKPFKCDVCGTAFAHTSTLQEHKRLHTGEKPYKCDVCDAAFTRTCDLQRHKRLHTGEKPYKCEFCGKAFAESGSVQTHKRMHTGEKPFKCDVCGIAFTRRTTLKRHKTLHTGEKPYKCDVCGVEFAQAGNLLAHKRVHTGK